MHKLFVIGKMKELEKQCLWEILLQTCQNFIKTFQLRNQTYGKGLYDSIAVMSGLSILKKAECQLVSIPGLNNHSERVCDAIWGNLHLTVWEAANGVAVGISIGYDTSKFGLKKFRCVVSVQNLC